MLVVAISSHDSTHFYPSSYLFLYSFLDKNLRYPARNRRRSRRPRRRRRHRVIVADVSSADSKQKDLF